MGSVYKYTKRAIENYGLTLLLAMVFVLTYQIQYLVFELYSEEFFAWLFTTESIKTPSPGWILSVISHGNLPHLIFNIGLLLVAGGLSEPHLKRLEYIIFFFITGGLSSLLHIAIWPADAPTVGASGAIFGFIGYSMYHYAQQHPESLFSKESTSGEILREQVNLLRSTYVVVGFPFILLWLLLAIVGIIDTGNATDGTHLFGFLLGILYVYIQPVLAGVCSVRS